MSGNSATEEFQVNDFEEYFAKVYETNSDRIEKISLTISITQIISIISFSIFFVALAFRCQDGFVFSWFVVFIFAFISLISITLMLNMYLKLKDIFDVAERLFTGETGINMGSIISYTCLNLKALCLFIYGLCFCFHMDGIINEQYSIISLPLYFVLILSLFYAIFILPAFIQNKMFAEIFLIFLYLVCSFVFLILLNMKLDRSIDTNYISSFVPIYTAIGANILFQIWSILNKQKEERIFGLIFLFSLIMVFICSLLIPLKADKFIYIDNWIIVMIGMLAYLSLITEKIVSYVMDSSAKEEELKHEK
jgi:peptidoglycan/LPS O-acetylase OafA/YrhL